jgi:hypothetical protein
MTVGVDNAAEALLAEPLGPPIHDLELPEAQAVGRRRLRRPTRKAILAQLFYVYGHEAKLEPPIEWRQDPHESRSWRYELHTLTWLKEALARHALGGDVETLAVARDATLDWVRSHAGDREEQSEFAWYDMAVGLRAPYVAYVLRACLAEEMLDAAEAELLLESVGEHGAALADGRNYAADNNHGLFQDEGLYLLARLLPALPAASAWRELALTRMKATLRATVDFEEGAHLEHSPAYQLAIVDLVARLVANVGELPELAPLLERMRRTAGWQVTPRGRLAQLGDTDEMEAPRWARDTARSLRGLRALPRSGQAFVREGESYLAVGAAHHGAAHKHSDDTGFLLVEGGQTILGDAGRWGYYEDEPDRLHARGAAAHNVLTVDSRDFEWRGADPYGSGLDAAGEDGGWHTILLRNPLLARQGVRHRRALLYRPAEALVVLDEVRSERQHEYARHLHFGPELEVERIGADRLAISGKGIAATLIDLAPGGEIDLARGQDEPRLGWTYPGDRERTPIWTAVARARRESALFASILILGGEPPSDVWGLLATHPLLRDDAAGLEFDDLTELDAILEVPLEDDDRRAAAGARQ